MSMIPLKCYPKVFSLKMLSDEHLLGPLLILAHIRAKVKGKGVVSSLILQGILAKYACMYVLA